MELTVRNRVTTRMNPQGGGGAHRVNRKLDCAYVEVNKSENKSVNISHWRSLRRKRDVLIMLLKAVLLERDQN